MKKTNKQNNRPQAETRLYLAIHGDNKQPAGASAWEHVTDGRRQKKHVESAGKHVMAPGEYWLDKETA